MFNRIAATCAISYYNAAQWAAISPEAWSEILADAEEARYPFRDALCVIRSGRGAAAAIMATRQAHADVYLWFCAQRGAKETPEVFPSSSALKHGARTLLGVIPGDIHGIIHHYLMSRDTYQVGLTSGICTFAMGVLHSVDDQPSSIIARRAHDTLGETTYEYTWEYVHRMPRPDRQPCRIEIRDGAMYCYWEEGNYPRCVSRGIVCVAVALSHSELRSTFHQLHRVQYAKKGWGIILDNPKLERLCAELWQRYGDL